MLCAEIAEVGAPRMVAIFDELSGFIWTACPQIHAQHWLGPGSVAPVDEFICTQPVWLSTEPGQIKSNRSQVDWANAIFPIIAGEKIAAGITNNGGPKVTDQVEHVSAKTVFICRRMPRLEDTGVNTAPEMFNKRTKHPAIKFGNTKIGIENNVRGGH